MDRRTTSVIGMAVDHDNLTQVVERIHGWGKARQSKYVCVANVHMAVTAREDASFGEVLRDADLVISDGMPLVWLLRLRGDRTKQRVTGREVVTSVGELFAREGLSVGFFGGKQETLDALVSKLSESLPGLHVAYAYSPPFRDLTDDEKQAVIGQFNASGAQVLFVGLGCPKQERWMNAHRGLIHAPMVGVGAAFEYIGGGLKSAPGFMQRAGLEWAYRLALEPRRLWKRYLYTNSVFLFALLKDLVPGGKRTAA